MSQAEHSELRDIPGLEGIYGITPDGRVWSYRTQRWATRYYTKTSTRRLEVSLGVGGRRLSFRVDHLLAITYVPNPNHDRYARFINPDGPVHVSNVGWFPEPDQREESPISRESIMARLSRERGQEDGFEIIKKDILPDEELLEVPDVPDVLVTRTGRVFKRHPRQHVRDYRELKTYSNSKGVGTPKVTVEGKTYKVKDLLARAFCENPNPIRFRYVRHVNNLLTDIHVDNLYWAERPYSPYDRLEVQELRQVSQKRGISSHGQDREDLIFKLVEKDLESRLTSGLQEWIDYFSRKSNGDPNDT